jgi:hypothetical protein
VKQFTTGNNVSSLQVWLSHIRRRVWAVLGRPITPLHNDSLSDMQYYTSIFKYKIQAPHLHRIHKGADDPDAHNNKEVVDRSLAYIQIRVYMWCGERIREYMRCGVSKYGYSRPI